MLATTLGRSPSWPDAVLADALDRKVLDEKLFLQAWGENANRRRTRR